MAITKILHLKEAGKATPSKHLKQAITYICNPEKTQNGNLIGALNCQPDYAYQQMLDTKKSYNKLNKRQGYHIIISFEEGEVTPETAYKIVESFAQDYLATDYEAIYSIHDDTAHIHGHIIFNSVSFRTGLKYRYEKGDWKKDIQPIVNQLCEQHSLSTIQLEEKHSIQDSKNQSWKSNKKETTTWNPMIRRDLDICIYRYVTKGTFDAYGWGIVENKQRFISQVMTSKAVARNCEDIDEAVLSFAEIKAVATGNPMIREKMEVDNEVQRLKLLKSSYASQRYSLQDNFMIRFPKLIAAAKERLDCIREDMSRKNEILVKEPEFAIKIGNAVFGERADAGNVFLKVVNESKKGFVSEIGNYKGFDLVVEKNWMGCDYLILKGRSEYKAEISMSAVGNMVKLENLFGGMESQEEFMQKRLEQYERDMEQSRAEYEKPFAHELELRQKLQRQSELNSILDLENERIVDVKSENMEIKQEVAMCR